MKVKKKSIQNLRDARAVVETIGVYNDVREIMSEKVLFLVLEIEEVSSAAANILKQVAISRGSDAVVHRDIVTGSVEKSKVLLPGTIRELKLISEELKKQPFGLPEVGNNILKILKNENAKPAFSVMGVLNVTPDSFSDGGDYFNEEDARKRFAEIEKEGADIIDVGAESSRPGAKRLEIQEELSRLKSLFPLFEKSSIPVSIDTYKSKIAEGALSKGAKIVNDISALRMDRKMVKVIRDYKSRVVLMHMQGTPKIMQDNPHYDDVVKEIGEFFEERVNFCLSNGIDEDKIILDPGIGFGKRQEDNLAILSNLEEFTSYGFPILIGTSRKSFIGRITGEDVKRRLDASLATAVYSYLKGVSIFRVHDVRQTKNALSVVSAIGEMK
ncbi:dihydropteroate synthase [candidate division WOR-3 bacterium]|nr:dihydropteroate synthase [candidate division WOR-3 bacterium]